MKLFEIPETIELWPGTGWSDDFRVDSAKNGAAPVDWDNITLGAYVCSRNDLDSIKAVVAINKGESGNFTGKLTAALIGALGITEGYIVFLYKITGDPDPHPLAIVPVEVKEALTWPV